MVFPEEWIAAGIALATTSVGTIFALLLASYDIQGAYLVLIVAVVLALLWGGASAGVSAAVFSCLFTWFFFVPPAWSFAMPAVSDAFTVGLVLGVALVITVMWQRQRRIIDELTDAVVDLRAKLKKSGRS